MLSKALRKQWRCNTGTPDIPYGGMIAFPDAEPMEMGPGVELPPIGSEEQAPSPTVPVASIVGEGRSSCIHQQEIAPSPWKDQGRTGTAAPSVQCDGGQVPKCPANCKGKKGCRPHH